MASWLAAKSIVQNCHFIANVVHSQDEPTCPIGSEIVCVYETYEKSLCATREIGEVLLPPSKPQLIGGVHAVNTHIFALKYAHRVLALCESCRLSRYVFWLPFPDLTDYRSVENWCDEVLRHELMAGEYAEAVARRRADLDLLDCRAVDDDAHRAIAAHCKPFELDLVIERLRHESLLAR